jgi:hypothetical protein
MAAWFGCALAACTFSDDHPACSIDADCSGGRECYKGFCVKPAADGGMGKPDAGNGNGNATGGSTGSMSNPMTAGGRSGSAGRSANGGAGAPAAAGTGVSVGECQEGVQRTCIPEGTGSMTSDCNRGLQACENGAWGPCMADSRPIAEACNGIDDDCDGNLDEATDVACYPTEMTGCTMVGTAQYTCAGSCRVGMQVCTNGELSACADFVGPTDEVCTGAGSPGDENCDGSSDEGCMCTGTDPRSCYDGPAGTEGVGICKAGTRTCSNGMLSACMNIVKPGVESCANQNADDDCNDTEDDIANLGENCTVPLARGPCSFGTRQCRGQILACVSDVMAGPETCNMMDDDCDGVIDDGFELQDDENNCGMCGKKCATGESCCAGMCRNIDNDPDHCGGCAPANKCAVGENCCAGACSNPMTDAAHCGGCAAINKCPNGNSCCAGQCADLMTSKDHCGTCGTSCSLGMLPSCCAGSCADLVSATNCGMCGNECTPDPDAGAITCECQMMGAASAVCMSSSGMGTCQ